jgi:beta-glucanase (GH16 family)
MTTFLSLFLLVALLDFKQTDADSSKEKPCATVSDRQSDSCKITESPTVAGVKATVDTKGSLFIQVNQRGNLQRASDGWCCQKCPGRSFCSPVSGNCYDTRAKDYYYSCKASSTPSPPSSVPSPPPSQGLAPPPASDGGLAPPPARAACCASCTDYCSPVSNSCYQTRSKPYYERCNDGPTQVVGDLVWSDEFDDTTGTGIVDRTKWNYWNGDNPSNQELQYYTDRLTNSFVKDGLLNIVGKCEKYKSFSFTSARLVTQHLYDWGPGHRIETRAKLPVGVGTWPAIWMLPSDNAYGGWPNSGEIDILETVGCTAGKVYGTVHTGDYNHMKGTQKGNHLDIDYSKWHNYTIDWTDEGIRWFVDGIQYHSFFPDRSTSGRWPFSQKFYLILNVAIGGSWGGFCLHRPPSCSDDKEMGLDQVMQIDYIHVNKLVSQTTVSS